MLSETIKQIRRRNYLSQAQFAKKLGVSQSAISQWENDLTRPNSYQLEAISTAFNVSIDELLVDNIADISPDIPKTPEARLLSKGMDKMPESLRKAIMITLEYQYPDFFKKGTDENDT